MYIMKSKNLWITAFALGLALSAQGQQNGGGISPEMLRQIKQAYQGTPADKAIRNAIANNNINKLAVNLESLNNLDTHFSHKVESKGISDQQSSGRCWLFTGLNVLRAKAIAKYDMGEFQFSQNYSFFWDQYWRKLSWTASSASESLVRIRRATANRKGRWAS